jgi:hypothetical protein
VISGRLADALGRRWVLLLGAATFTLASVMCAAAPGAGLLIAARCVQGGGAALMVPTSLGLLLEITPSGQQAPIVGVWTAMNGTAAVAGPVIGGLLIQASWRWIFLVNLPVGLFVVGAGARSVVRGMRGPDGALPDALGAIALAAAVGLLVLAVVEGPVWGWGSAPWDTTLVVSVASATVLALRCARHPSPIVEPGLLRVRPFATANAVLLAFYVAFAAMILESFLLLQDRWHYTTLEAGVAFAPGPLSSAACAISCGWLARRLGTRALAVCGPVALAAASGWWLTHVGSRLDYWVAYLPGVMLAGAGGGLTQVPLFASVSALPADRAATGTAILSMTRQVSSALGVAMLVAIIARPTSAGIGAFRLAWITTLVAALLAAAIAGAGIRSPESAQRPNAELDARTPIPASE